MQFRNKALAGIAVAIALAGCASKETRPAQTAQSDALAQQKAQLALQQQMAYQSNLACKNAPGGKQSAGQAAPEVAPPSCNCSCTPEGSKSSVSSGKNKVTASTKKGTASTSSE